MSSRGRGGQASLSQPQRTVVKEPPEPAVVSLQSCQLFINVPVEAASVDYHVSLAQTALQVCLVHPELQSEIYCQLMKQISCRPPQKYSLMQVGVPGAEQLWARAAQEVGKVEGGDWAHILRAWRPAGSLGAQSCPAVFSVPLLDVHTQTA